MPLHVSNTMRSSSGGKNCIIQHLVSSHLQVAIPCTGAHVEAYNKLIIKQKFVY